MTDPTPDTPFSDLARRIPVLGPHAPGYSAYTRDVVLEGAPDGVVRPVNEAEMSEVLAFASDRDVPVTFAGGQTSVTGASVALSGLLVATEGMDRLLDIGRDPETGGMVARAEPGIFLGDFQRALEAEGWFYPPDPTSRNEARLGATVATNATGEDTLLYGPTRAWVRALRVVRADGTPATLRRPVDHRPREEKGTAGYFDAEHPIDHLIGSEGTLAAISEVTVDVIPRPPGVFTGLAFFPTLISALEFVVAARRCERVRPRALELIDAGALDLVSGNPEGITWPEGTGAAIEFKQDVRDPADRDAALAAWFDLLETTLRDAGATGFLDHVLVVDDGPGRERIRSFRHRIPATLNEIVSRFRERGGGKVGTDWWVPYEQAPGIMERWRQVLTERGLRHVVFGHIGNGHPHWNFFPEDATQRMEVMGVVREMCTDAVAHGGGVAGEHGLGKLKRDFLAIQYPPQRIRAMRDLKRTWDPKWILGQGNLFDPEAM